MNSQLRIANVDRLSVGQAARTAGVSAESIRAWIRRGRLPAERTPLGALVSACDLDALIAAREQKQREGRR